MKFSSAFVALSTFLSPSFVVKVQSEELAPDELAPNTQNPIGNPEKPDWQYKCDDATPVYCDASYQGNTVLGGDDDRAVLLPKKELRCPMTDKFNSGVWFKMSIGQDQIFQVTFSTCNGVTTYDTEIQVFTGTECGPGRKSVDITMMCVDSNADIGNNDLGCNSFTSIVADQNPIGDTDYWIFVEGDNGATGPFQLDVTCSGVPAIDPWFIQRSAFPPPDVTNIDPLEGGTWLELNDARIDDSTNPATVPGLVATVHALPADGERCSEGTDITDQVIEDSLTNTPCTSGAPDCPLSMSGGTPVLQTFALDTDFDPASPIWFPDDGNFDGQFRFCVETKLMLDYDPDAPGDEEVSYFETYYVVDVDFTSEKFIQSVAALPRNPANIDDLFDGFRVIPYVCGDGNLYELNRPYDPEDPDPENIDDEFLVGENFRICLKPDVEFSYFEIEKFNTVVCESESDDSASAAEAQKRIIIVDSEVPENESLLTTIFTTADDPKAAPADGIAFESAVTSGFLLPSGKFSCHGTVELKPKSRRRMLDDGRMMQEESSDAVTGAFTVQLTIVKPGLSTGAIAGISVAVVVVFLLVVFILYRRGCFAKRNKTNKPPKTIAVDENSETTGDDPENASN